jgi:hypothetical protein
MRKRLIEFAKSILILVLLLTAVGLTLLVGAGGQVWEMPLVGTLASTLGLTGAEPAYSAPETVTYEAARPDTVVVTTDEGHHTVTRSFEAVDAVFDIMGRHLSDALATGQTPQSVSQTQWEAALSGQGVYFHYWGAVPFSALADWFRVDLGCDALGEVQASQLVLAVEDTVTLYFRDQQGYWRCATDTAADSLLEQMESYRPDGSIFAFESDLAAVSHLSRESLVELAGAPTVREAAADDPLETDSSFLKNTATALGFNPFAETSYTASDGSRQFSEGDGSLSVSTDGVIRYVQRTSSGETARFAAASTEPSALIEQARALLETLTESSLGDAQLVMTGFALSGSTATVTFTYFLDGIPVCLSSGDAATVTFNGTTLSSLTLRARTYTLSDETTTLLPAAQAAALVAADTYLTVEYADYGGEALTCGWVAEG